MSLVAGLTPARLIVLLAAFGVSLGLTRAVLRFALTRGVLDMPADRKLHTAPTPRGGGVGIVIVTLLGTLLAGAIGWIAMPVVLTLGVGGLAVAIVGWIDDRKGLSPRIRFTVHVLAAVWAVYVLGDIALLRFGWDTTIARYISTGLSILLVAWAINAYNFMDGIDALAGSEAAFVGAIGGALALVSGHADVAFLSLLIAAASLGFLPWNLPPARIFMGDVCSGFLGYCFAALALFSERHGALPVIGWLVLLGVFAFDSTVTLCRRIIEREVWFSTHRSSAYQRVAFRLGRHGPVTAAAMAVNIVLAGLCWIGWSAPNTWPIVVAGAAGLLTILYFGAERYSPVERG